MEQKSLTNDQILDEIYDLADENGMKIDDFILKLQADAEAVVGKSHEGLPEEIISELDIARNLKKDNRNSKKESKKSEKIKNEIDRFKTDFPDVMPKDIPEPVWEEVAGGVSLVHAYALFLITECKDNEYARKVNEENSSRATSKTADGETEPAFTKEQVESMSPKEVSKNYKHIIKSISKWKL